MSRVIQSFFELINQDVADEQLASYNKGLTQALGLEQKPDPDLMAPFYARLVALNADQQDKFLAKLTQQNQLAVRSYELYCEVRAKFSFNPRQFNGPLSEAANMRLSQSLKTYIRSIDESDLPRCLDVQAHVLNQLNLFANDIQLFIECVRGGVKGKLHFATDGWSAKKTQFKELEQACNQLFPNGYLLPLWKARNLFSQESVLSRLSDTIKNAFTVLRERQETLQNKFTELMIQNRDSSSCERVLSLTLLRKAATYFYFQPDAIDLWYKRYHNRTGDISHIALQECCYSYAGTRDWSPTRKNAPKTRKLPIGFFRIANWEARNIPEQRYQLLSNDIEWLLMLLRASFPELHHPSDRQLAIQYIDGFSDRLWHDRSMAFLQTRSVPGRKPLEPTTQFKSIGIVSQANCQFLTNWFEHYKDQNCILYGIVHLGHHWVPFFILNDNGDPVVLTFDPMYAAAKRERVELVRTFFYAAFPCKFVNVDQYDGQYNDTACGAASFFLLYEVLLSMFTEPVIELTDSTLFVHITRLAHNGGKASMYFAGIGRGDVYKEAFFQSADRVVSTVIALLRQFGPAQLESLSTADGGEVPLAYTNEAINTFVIVEANTVDQRILEQRLEDLKNEVVSQLVGLPYRFSTLSDAQIEKQLIGRSSAAFRQYKQLSAQSPSEATYMRALFDRCRNCLQRQVDVVQGGPTFDEARANKALEKAVSLLNDYWGFKNLSKKEQFLQGNALETNSSEAVRCVTTPFENGDMSITSKMERLCLLFLDGDQLPFIRSCAKEALCVYFDIPDSVAPLPPCKKRSMGALFAAPSARSTTAWVSPRVYDQISQGIERHFVPAVSAHNQRVRAKEAEAGNHSWHLYLHTPLAS